MSLVWRVVVFISVSLNFISVLGFSYFVIAYDRTFQILVGKGKIETLRDFDSIAAAAMIGRLDVVSLLLAFIGILIALMSIGVLWYFRREALESARSEARNVAPKALEDYMNKNGTNIVGACLNDGEVLARIQERLAEFGIDDADDAESVDSDANWTEGER